MEAEKNLSPDELLKALKNQEFVLYYQPQYNLFTTRFEGVEALIRWNHPTRGFLLPDEFIPLAEKSTAIIQIGEWVVKTACRQIKEWLDKGFPPIRMAVNISQVQLEQEDFVDLVVNILKETNLKPENLELELSEKILIQDEDRSMLNTIDKLHSLGVQIALDDFGTGFTSIGYLKRLPIDRIKIDRTFINNITINSADAAIVRAIVTLASTLNLEVTAEGVENLMQLQKLTQNQNIGVQGFYISEALPAKELEKFLMLEKNNKPD